MSTSQWRRRTIWTVLGLGLGCGAPSDPVLPVVAPEAPTEERADDASPRSRLPTNPEMAVEPIAEPNTAAVVDVRWLGGRRFSTHRGAIAEQLGDLQSRSIVDDRQGEAFDYEQATLFVVRDTIYRVNVRLPEPLSPNDTLEAIGFPRYDRSFRETHREYRVSFKWGFERFRLLRKSRNSKQVERVEVWHTEPVKAGL